MNYHPRDFLQKAFGAGKLDSKIAKAEQDYDEGRALDTLPTTEDNCRKCGCGGEWIVYPLYKRCQQCGIVKDDSAKGLEALSLLVAELRNPQRGIRSEPG